MKDFFSSLSDVIDVNKDGKVTYEEWCNWIKSTREPFNPKDDVEELFQTHSEFGAWRQLFFKLSQGHMKEIKLNKLKKYIKENDDEKVIWPTKLIGD